MPRRGLELLDLTDVLPRGEKLHSGVVFVKRPDQGKMTDVTFIKCADGYWIEIVEPARLKNLGR